MSRPLACDCPSRGRAASVPVARQPPLRGSDREIRGAVIRTLGAADGHAMAAGLLRTAIGTDAGIDDRWDRVLDGLERDGLVHRSGGDVRLGAARIGA